MKSDESKGLSTHETSMSTWVKRLRDTLGTDVRFAADILAEESAKFDRLRRLKQSIGLPVYDTHEYELPEELEDFLLTCRQITNDGQWNLALRFSNPPRKEAFFRQLDAGFGDAVAAGERYGASGPFLAAVTPYRVPDRSGTLWIKDRQTVLEMVCGPHNFLTKAPPDQSSILRCSYEFPYLRVNYSTDDQTLRRILYESLRDTVYAVLGCELCDLAVVNTKLYAEFHWHRSVGYRFIECSFESAWA